MSATDLEMFAALSEARRERDDLRGDLVESEALVRSQAERIEELEGALRKIAEHGSPISSRTALAALARTPDDQPEEDGE